MLPKSKRLNLKKDFKWVASGQRVETNYLKLFIRTGDNLFPKVGIAVSSKSFKKASSRNRVKRLVSAAFEELYFQLPSKINIVALPKTGVVGVKSADVLLDLEENLNKAHVILGTQSEAWRTPESRSWTSQDDTNEKNTN